MAASKAAGSGQAAKKPRKISEKSLQNIRPLTMEDRRKGGKAAAAKMKRNAEYRKLIQEIGIVRPPEEIYNAMLELGMPEDQISMDTAMIYGQYIGAMQGDSRCATWIRDTAGQMPVKQLEINDKRDELSLFDRLLQASQAALDVKQQAYIQIPTGAPEIIEVNPDRQAGD